MKAVAFCIWGEEMYELKYCMIYKCKSCPLNRKCEKEIKDQEKKKAVKSGEK